MPDSLTALYVAVFLLPGFVGYLVLSRVYDRKIEDGFDKTAFVILITAASFSVIKIFRAVTLPSSAQPLTEDVLNSLFIYLPIQTAICAVCGLIFAWLGNWTRFQHFLAVMGASRKAGHAAVIAGTIAKNPNSFFRIRLKNGGYIVGHPVLYSLDGEETCMFLEKAAFRRKRADRNESVPRQIPVDGKGVLLVNFDEVLFIEVL